PIPRAAEDLARARALLARFDDLERHADPKALAQLNMDFYQELRAMTGNVPLRDISDRLYFMTHRIWLSAVPHLNLQDEIVIFRREVADILAAMEIGDLDAVGYIRRSHISMAFTRLQRYASRAAGSQ
ncbi:MAG: FCD domain-containing protein, partial [Dongiaceae bacterium]